jgi:hypothetical protein
MRSKLFILISFFVLAITMMHAQTCVAPPQGLVAWWAAEGNANDSAGTNNGSIKGNVTFVAGKVGQAFHFDGTDFVQVPNSTSLNPATISLEGWIRATEQSQLMENGRAVVFAKAGPCGYGGYGTILTGSGTPVYASPFVCIPQPGDGNNFASSDLALGTYPLLDGQWHHIALAYTGNEGTPYVLTRAYVDGTLALVSSWGGLTPRRLRIPRPTSSSVDLGGASRRSSGTWMNCQYTTAPSPLLKFNKSTRQAALASAPHRLVHSR